MKRDLPDILQRIVERRRLRLKESRVANERSSADLMSANGERFLAGLREQCGKAIIAEVKMGSPRLGSLADRVRPERQVEIYAENGAAAISVVVEPDFFFGSYDLLRRCRRASDLPFLAKDFIVDRRQLDWAAAAGADAVLLIASLVNGEELSLLADEAGERGLACLLELHGAEDLELLSGRDWDIVGVNNRDLRTFEVDLGRSVEMRPLLPEGVLTVAESGINGAADVKALAAAGFDAFLVGERLLLADDPGAALRWLVGRES